MNKEKEIVEPLQLLNDRYEEIVLALELCKNRNLILPALIILYTAIDSVAYLYSENPSVEKRFTNWVDKFMLKSEKFSFTSIDLYSARCGILHTLTSTSSLVLERKAKKGIYSFGKTNEDDLKKVIKPELFKECFFVKLNDLVELFYKGFLEFYESIFEDTKLKENVIIKCEKYYNHTTVDKMVEELGIKSV